MKELSLENFLSLPELVIGTSPDMAVLLSEELINLYYKSDLRKYIMRYFDKYNDTQFIFCLGYENKITPLYGEEIVTTSNISNKVSTFTTNKIDRQIWAYNFYQAMLNLSKKLTKREAKYLIRTFFNKLSEETISEEFNISRTGLQRIKKSALVKAYLEFESDNNIKLNK